MSEHIRAVNRRRMISGAASAALWAAKGGAAVAAVNPASAWRWMKHRVLAARPWPRPRPARCAAPSAAAY